MLGILNMLLVILSHLPLNLCNIRLQISPGTSEGVMIKSDWWAAGCCKSTTSGLILKPWILDIHHRLPYCSRLACCGKQRTNPPFEVESNTGNYPWSRMNKLMVIYEVILAHIYRAVCDWIGFLADSDSLKDCMDALDHIICHTEWYFKAFIKHNNVICNTKEAFQIHVPAYLQPSIYRTLPWEAVSRNTCNHW